MKLYTFPLAPNPARLDYYLKEKQLDLPTEIVDLTKGEHRSPEHLARHPGAAVPVLELDDGRYLVESLAIIEYLEELHPAPPMIGATPEARAFTRATERYIELQVFSRLVRYLHATNSPLGLPPNPALAENEQKFLPDAFARVDAQIGDSPFVMGDVPSIADCTLIAGFNFCLFFGWQMPDGYPNIQRWFDAFTARHAG